MRNEDIKSSLFIDGMITYVHNPKKKMNIKLLVLVSDRARLQETKLICKSQILSYISSVIK